MNMFYPIKMLGRGSINPSFVQFEGSCLQIGNGSWIHHKSERHTTPDFANCHANLERFLAVPDFVRLETNPYFVPPRTLPHLHRQSPQSPLIHLETLVPSTIQHCHSPPSPLSLSTIATALAHHHHHRWSLLRLYLQIPNPNRRNPLTRWVLLSLFDALCIEWLRKIRLLIGWEMDLPWPHLLLKHSLKVKAEVQMRKGLRWIPRHPETRKGINPDPNPKNRSGRPWLMAWAAVRNRIHTAIPDLVVRRTKRASPMQQAPEHTKTGPIKPTNKSSPMILPMVKFNESTNKSSKSYTNKVTLEDKAGGFIFIGRLITCITTLLLSVVCLFVLNI
ncbi:hypothetical protein LguiA_030045 [Lonicera macranthoides]